MPLLLTETDVAELLETRALVDLMETTLADFSSGRTVQPVRTTLRLEEHESFIGVMPAALPGHAGAGLKVVTLAPRNAARGLPTHLATILVLDPETGALEAILDGRLVTERRTAAVSAAAARRLARAGAETLTLLGSGVQALSHLEAFAAVLPLREARVWSPNPERRAAFARAHDGGRGFTVRAVASAEEAVRGADLVVAATSARTPVLRGEWLAEGAHVSAVGACTPDWRELDGEAVRRSRVYVDSLAAARQEAGDLIGAEREGGWSFAEVVGELGALFAGGLAGRRDAREVTLFKSLGLACEDVASARWLIARARERGVGISIAI